MKRILTTLVTPVMTVALLAAVAAAQTTQYTVTDLGAFGGKNATAYGINYTGRVGGSAALPGGQQRAFITGIGSTLYDVGTLGGPNSAASGPNASGALPILAETSKKDPFGNDFCGYGTNLICLPAVWNGTLTALPTLGGNNGQALVINNLGQLTGTAETATKDPSCTPPQTLQYEGAIWGPNPGQVQALPPLAGDTVSFAFWINNSGQVVGSSGACATTPLLPFAYGPHAVLWQNGVPAALSNLGGSMLGVGVSINDLGQVLGGSDMPSETPGFPFVQVHGVMYSKGLPAQDLGAVGKDFSSLPTALNNNGQAVGASCDAMGNCRAFLWQNKVMLDLNSLISANSPLYLVFAEGINDAGEIAGMAVDANGNSHAFVATPGKSLSASANLEPSEHPLMLDDATRQLIRRQLWAHRR